LANYLTNAVKYTSPGGTVVVAASSTGGSVRIEVRDSGPGISEEDQRRLFQEFSRLGRVGGDGKKVGGTGLGLSIVRRIAEAHGGCAGVISKPGSGSTFFLEFKCLQPKVPGVRPASDEGERR
jgi:signal transduction histidine kinase